MITDDITRSESGLKNLGALYQLVTNADRNFLFFSQYRYYVTLDICNYPEFASATRDSKKCLLLGEKKVLKEFIQGMRYGHGITYKQVLTDPIHFKAFLFFTIKHLISDSIRFADIAGMEEDVELIQLCELLISVDQNVWIHNELIVSTITQKLIKYGAYL